MISTTVSCKPIHTDGYLDFTSHHSIVHKAVVVRTLFSRAATVSSCAVSLQDEHAYIKRTLGANHYPILFVCSYSRSYFGPRQNTSPPRQSVVIPCERPFGGDQAYPIFSRCEGGFLTTLFPEAGTCSSQGSCTHFAESQCSV